VALLVVLLVAYVEDLLIKPSLLLLLELTSMVSLHILVGALSLL
jgi:hypothetical protein